MFISYNASLRSYRSFASSHPFDSKNIYQSRLVQLQSFLNPQFLFFTLAESTRRFAKPHPPKLTDKHTRLFFSRASLPSRSQPSPLQPLCWQGNRQTVLIPEASSVSHNRWTNQSFSEIISPHISFRFV